MGLVSYQAFGMRQGGKKNIEGGGGAGWGRGGMRCLCIHTYAILISNEYGIENILNTSPKISFSSKEIQHLAF